MQVDSKGRRYRNLRGKLGSEAAVKDPKALQVGSMGTCQGGTCSLQTLSGTRETPLVLHLEHAPAATIPDMCYEITTKAYACFPMNMIALCMGEIVAICILARPSAYKHVRTNIEIPADPKTENVPCCARCGGCCPIHEQRASMSKLCASLSKLCQFMSYVCPCHA